MQCPCHGIYLCLGQHLQNICFCLEWLFSPSEHLLMSRGAQTFHRMQPRLCRKRPSLYLQELLYLWGYKLFAGGQQFDLETWRDLDFLPYKDSHIFVKGHPKIGAQNRQTLQLEHFQSGLRNPGRVMTANLKHLGFYIV